MSPVRSVSEASLSEEFVFVFLKPTLPWFFLKALWSCQVCESLGHGNDILFLKSEVPQDIMLNWNGQCKFIISQENVCSFVTAEGKLLAARVWFSTFVLH